MIRSLDCGGSTPLCRDCSLLPGDAARRATLPHCHPEAFSARDLLLFLSSLKPCVRYVNLTHHG